MSNPQTNLRKTEAVNLSKPFTQHKSKIILWSRCFFKEVSKQDTQEQAWKRFLLHGHAPRLVQVIQDGCLSNLFSNPSRSGGVTPMPWGSAVPAAWMFCFLKLELMTFSCNWQHNFVSHLQWKWEAGYSILPQSSWGTAEDISQLSLLSSELNNHQGFSVFAGQDFQSLTLTVILLCICCRKPSFFLESGACKMAK